MKKLVIYFTIGTLMTLEQQEDGLYTVYVDGEMPGESVTVNMAWIVNESDIKNMYLNLNGTGCSYEFDDAIMENGLVYIGK